MEDDPEASAPFLADPPPPGGRGGRRARGQRERAETVGQVGQVAWKAKLTVTEDPAAPKVENAPELSMESLGDAFRGWSPLRNMVRTKIVNNPWFERFWLMVIVFNCVVLTLEDPWDKECKKAMCKFTSIADYVLTGLYFAEMVLKMYGLGVWRRKGAYFRDNWNKFDCVIVTAGTVAFLLGVIFGIEGPVLSSLRAFRLLRPLKAVSVFPAVRLLLQAFLGSIAQLTNVMLLYAGFILLMSIVSVEVWKGTLGYHCVTDASYTAMQGKAALDPAAPANYTLAPDPKYGLRTCVRGASYPPEYTSFGGHVCEWGTRCVEYGGDPEGGRLAFNNIAVAALTLFEALTLESWVATMFLTMDATGVAAAWFWVVLVLLGAFFILNLTIVIITEAFEAKRVGMQLELFRQIDTDGGGDLDKDEIKQLLGDLDYEFESDLALDRVFRDMDRDGNGVVTLDEFLIYFEKNTADMGRLIAKKGGVRSFMTDLQVWWYGKKTIAKETIKEKKATSRGKKQQRGGVLAFIHDMVEKPERSQRPTLAKSFYYGVLLTIVLNTTALAAEGHGISDGLKAFLDTANRVFTVIFVVEMALKVTGLGMYGYFGSKSNVSDFILVAISLPALFGAGSKAVSVFRVLRIVRLTDQVPVLGRWLKIMISSIKAASVLTVLISLIVFISALLGMQLMGGLFCHLDGSWDKDAAGVTDEQRAVGPGCGGIPRANYDSIADSMLTSFQILTGEDWNVVLYNGMRAAGDGAAVYFVLYFILGNYLLLNLFIAVLLSNRDLKEETEEMLERRASMRSSSPPRQQSLRQQSVMSQMVSQGISPRMHSTLSVGPRRQQSALDSTHGSSASLTVKLAVADQDAAKAATKPPGDPAAAQTVAIPIANDDEDEDGKLVVARAAAIPPEFLAGADNGGASVPFTRVPTLEDTLENNLERLPTHASAESEPDGRVVRCFPWLKPYMQRTWSLCLITSTNRVRRTLMVVVKHRAFEWLVLLSITVSTVCLAVETPARPDDHPTAVLLRNINFVMLFVFTAEAAFKIVVMGFVLHKGSYLRKSAWNRLDFLIVVVSLVSLIPGLGQLALFKLLRAIRPLRFINKSQGMRVVVYSLVKSIPPLLNVIFISCVVWLIFAILGVQLFAGTFYRCSLNAYGDMSLRATDPILTRTDCLDPAKCAGCRWETHPSNFDGTGAAFLTLFEIASLEGWVGVMYNGMDGVSYEVAPIRNYRPYFSYYFVCFVMFGSFFLMNLFIGVLIDTYYTEKEKAGFAGGMHLAKAQKMWVRQHHLMLELISPSEEGSTEFQKRFGLAVKPTLLNRVVQHKAFEAFIMVCVLANVGIMAAEQYPVTPSLVQLTEVTDYLFVSIFFVEGVMKLVNYGRVWYFKDRWNRFDFVIVVLSIVGTIGEHVGGGGSVVSAFRAMRLLRLVRMSGASGVRKILSALYLAIPSVFNVACIVGLLFFIYAVLGVGLFALLDRDNANNELGPYSNFENFYIACLTLMRVTTGGSWQRIMAAARVEPPYCSEQLNNCGDELNAVLYFVTFTLSGMYVLLNLFIAVIIDSFSEAGSEKYCTSSYIAHVKECWRYRSVESTVQPDTCPNLSGWLNLPAGVPMSQFEHFLQDIGPPLGVSKFMPSRCRKEVMAELNIVPHPLTGLVLETEAYPKLFRHKFGAEDLPEKVRDALDEAEARVNSSFHRDLVTKQTLIIFKAQRIIRAWLFRHRARRALQERIENRVLTAAAAGAASPLAEPNALAQSTSSRPNPLKQSVTNTDDGASTVTRGPASPLSPIPSQRALRNKKALTRPQRHGESTAGGDACTAGDGSTPTLPEDLPSDLPWSQDSPDRPATPS